MKLPTHITKIHPGSLTEELTGINTEAYFQNEFSYQDLFDEDFDEWDKIKSHFRNDFLFFERALFKLHFRRKKEFNLNQRRNILKFLAIGYYFSKDIRFFNEFLFFYDGKESHTPLYNLVISYFHQNLDGEPFHPYPLASRAEVKAWTNEFNKEKESKNTDLTKKMTIGLIGLPLFFYKIKKQLEQLGFNVKVYFVPYHANKKVRFLIKYKMLWKLLGLLKKLPSFKTLNYPVNSKKIKAKILQDQPEIGFHKLGFIIRENIYSAFPKGLINDHWGVLPYVRGRSTIEYSLLFGFPVAATTHFIEKTIDTGNLVQVFTYDIDHLKTINEIKKKVKSDLTNRAVESIYRYSQDENIVIPNDTQKGLTFYSMHSFLTNYIEKNILS